MSKIPRVKRLLTIALAACLLAGSSHLSNAEVLRIHEDRTSGPFVSVGADGELVYQPFTNRGDVIMDYSYAGYKANEVPIPDVPAYLLNRERLDPLLGEAEAVGTMAYPMGPDSRERIQTALDAVAAMEPMASGYRGAVVLNRGIYYIEGGLNIPPGVVLRGRGDGPDGTRLLIHNPQGVGITLGHASEPVAIEGSTTRIADLYVPSGSQTVSLEDASGYAVGDHVEITKTVNQAWVDTLRMNFPEGPRPGRRLKPWTPEAYQLKHIRRVEAMEGSRLHLDVPLPQSFAAEFGGGTVTRIDVSDEARNVGVEDLRVISNYDRSVTDTTRSATPYLADEASNLQTGILVRSVDSWVRNCTILHTSRKAVGVEGGRFVTVRDCRSLEPVSIIRGARRYSFSNSNSSMTLFYNCFAESGRHDFVTGSRDTGPIAFVRGHTEDARAASETHQRWATGVLFDRIRVEDSGGIMAINRGEAGSGHGWSGANVVVWNCVAPFVQVENPPTPEQNFAIGCISTAPPTVRWTGLKGDGVIESPQTPVRPESLFEAQLVDRVGPERAASILR
jgi:hypothetical protein